VHACGPIPSAGFQTPRAFSARTANSFFSPTSC
jgi:hypothetical protein